MGKICPRRGGFDLSVGNTFECQRGNFDDETTWLNSTVIGGVNCDGYPTTAPIAQYAIGSSPYNIFDMAGNVWEWVSDFYFKDYYSQGVTTNPKGPVDGQRRVVRGAGWFEPLSNNLEYGPRTANRWSFPPGEAYFHLGFRCAR